jgi:hypothetical protein
MPAPDNNTLRTKIFTLALVLLSSACVQLKPKTPEASQQDPGVNAGIQETQNNSPHNLFQWRLIDNGEPHYYLAKIEWNFKSAHPIHAYVNTEDTQISSLVSPLTLKLPVGMANYVEMKINDPVQGLITVWAETIETPKDYFINGEVILKKDLQLKVQRLFLSDKAKIITMGYTLQITAKNIIAQGGRIETFPEGQTAAVGIQGRSAGIIEISSDKATGDLEVLMRGESGGLGLSGAPWPRPQVNARTAKPGEVICIPQLSTPVPSQTCFCAARPENGIDGPKGNKGYPGKPGAPGGDTGLFKLTLHNSTTALNLNVLQFPGHGGAGGNGGPGQTGGQPSPAGIVEGAAGYGFRCGPVSNGISLGNGEPGDPGPIGPQGAINSYCLTLGAEEVCYN